MKQYFAVANVWLALALILYLGGKKVGYEPPQLAFFGYGRWLSPAEYYFAIGCCVAMAIACLVAHFMYAAANRPTQL